MKEFEKKRYVITEEKLRKKESHLKGQKSKRTSPKEVTFDTQPAHMHNDREYWIRRTQQSVLKKAAGFTKKLLHKTKRLLKKFKRK